MGEEQYLEVRPPAFADIKNPLNQHRVFLEDARWHFAVRQRFSIASGA